MESGSSKNRKSVIILGGGDIASGVALRLHRTGLNILITELKQPMAIRRLVSYAEAVYAGFIQIEDVIGRRIDHVREADSVWEDDQIAVIADESASSINLLQPVVVVDGRMTKRSPDYKKDIAPMVIGLGPGFIAGDNCHAVVETNRGHFLGRVSWDGSAEADTGIPEAVLQHQADRVLRSPADGTFTPVMEIGKKAKKGDILAEVDGIAIQAPFDGVVRGLLHSGIKVREGLKVGDLDPRNDQTYARLVSDKGLAVGGGVLEAILSRSVIQKQLWA